MNVFYRLTGPSWLALCFTGSTVRGQAVNDHAGTPPNASVASSRDTLPRNIATRTEGGSTYERDAILIEPHSFGDRVYQGKDRKALVTLNVFGTTRLADVLARSPKAANEAGVYDRNHRSGAFMMLGGIVSLVAGGVASQLGDGGGSYPLWLGGTLLLGSGSVRMNRAIHALPRAVWWYNHDLVTGN